MYLEDVIDILKKAERLGNEKDDPEGTRYIMLSDTLANKMIEGLEEELVRDVDLIDR
jgi:hypothetical protein